MKNDKDFVEQALLHVNNRRNPQNGKILAETFGISRCDEEELIGWAFDFEGDVPLPSENHNGFADASNEPHLYFHPLPSGSFALGSLSTEYVSESNETGLYSHCLVISPQLLKSFDNNVVALYHSLLSGKNFQFFVPTPNFVPQEFSLKPLKIEPVSLSMINRDMLDALRDYPGITTLAGLVASSISSVCTLFTWISPSIQLINGLIQCFPLTLRTEISFATSLHFSSLRPLRVMGVYERSAVVRQICQKYLLPLFNVLNMDQNRLRNQILSQPSWASLIYRILDLNQYDFFEKQMEEQLKFHLFENHRGTPDWHSLNRLGEKIIRKLERETIVARSNKMDCGGQIGETSLAEKSSKNKEVLRGDFAHHVFECKKSADDKNSSFSSDNKNADPIFDNLDLQFQQSFPGNIIHKVKKTKSSFSQQHLKKRFPKFENEIRQIDSLVARSLFGDNIAHEMLNHCWKKLRNSLNFEEINIIRESYIQLVQSVIILPRDPAYPKHPRRSIDALEIINIFLEE
ncbi:MAG: hypothetical protein LBT05_00645 [Planctomycetaceae bacterium]|jgi:hypothetical protein|nr:hypothetical protein [Planctomycetaceae bacterium]